MSEYLGLGWIPKTHTQSQFIQNTHLIWLLQVAFKPLAEIIVSTQFSLVVENGNVVHCNCFAQAQRSSASFLESHVYADSLYVNVESIAIAKLCNHSVIQAEFTVGKPEGRAG